ncbi:hypothetical protein [Oceanibacterium hippocampi]|uniref:Uncharacterized protein n=1 Tax=Oceanibacterium hippocampi TaxID=745714 RepID=A0A1Y5RDI6_9PROT|nr:hypothetical protein [Oceanibacterium hippocampi]SLN12390.1 hypothetical protein OCH7691_00155 [Oceanibacterium hippocampi]
MGLSSFDFAGTGAYRYLLVLLAAGGIGEVVLELLSWWVAPTVLGMAMRPDILVSALAHVQFGLEIPVKLAVSIHLALGLLGFPLLFALVRAVSGARSSVAPALVTGVALWAIAQAILAPLAGRPFMLGFGPYTWASLVVHVVYMLVVARTVDVLRR